MATTPEPIAIVGIGCRLAGGINDPAQFWTFLTEAEATSARYPRSAGSRICAGTRATPRC